MKTLQNLGKRAPALTWHLNTLETPCSVSFCMVRRKQTHLCRTLTKGVHQEFALMHVCCNTPCMFTSLGKVREFRSAHTGVRKLTVKHSSEQAPCCRWVLQGDPRNAPNYQWDDKKSDGCTECTWHNVVDPKCQPQRD